MHPMILVGDITIPVNSARLLLIVSRTAQRQIDDVLATLYNTGFQEVVDNLTTARKQITDIVLQIESGLSKLDYM